MADDMSVAEQHQNSIGCYDEYCRVKREQLRQGQRYRDLLAAMLRHAEPGRVVEHPEINDRFFALLAAHGPLRIGEIER